MKKKFSKILGIGLTLALLASMLVMAAPVAADSPADTDVGFEFGETTGTAEWANIIAAGGTVVSTLPTGGLGNYSVKLTKGATQGSTYVEFVPAAGTMISDLEALTNDWGFWYHLDVAPGPQLELLFRSASYDSDTGNGEVYITLMPAQGPVGGDPAEYHAILDAWTEVEVSDALITVVHCGRTDAGEGFADFVGGGFDAMLTAVISEVGDTWELARVRAEMYEGGVRNCYIDDITIDGTTYELEPIFLNAEYYSVGDSVEVTVPNFAANTDPIRVNPVTGEPATGEHVNNWSVTVTSDSDSFGTTVELQETGANTGVLTGSFATVDTTPAGEDELYVQDGDTITVEYGDIVIDATLGADWGAGVGSTTSIDVLVDDTDPTITDELPADGTTEADATPVIGASYSDAGSDINVASVEMFVNDVEIDDEDAVATTAGVTYTPSVDLPEGSHDVTVNVSDNAGNEATLSWSFRVASWLEGSPVEDSTPTDGSLDALDTVGVAVSGALGVTADAPDIIKVGRYASNPQPEATPVFDMIDDGFFDVQVIGTVNATQIVIKFAATGITAESTAHVWDELEGAWLECSDQGYNSLNDYLWIKVRDDTTPNIAELEGTPFAIGGEPAVEEDISTYYKGLTGDAEVVETADLLTAANDWAGEVVPSGFTEFISTTELLALANEWAAN